MSPSLPSGRQSHEQTVEEQVPSSHRSSVSELSMTAPAETSQDVTPQCSPQDTASIQTIHLRDHPAHENHALSASSLDLQPNNAQDSSTAVCSLDSNLEQPATTPAFQRWSILRRSKRAFFFDWWDELLSMTIGVVCTALAIAILAYMQNRAQTDWKLPIQPNSLIAVFATLSRMAMIYPLSEFLGHLKWGYFASIKPLSMMHAFDVASRGPIGSIKFLWKCRASSLLGSCAALLTILLLAFQPFMQQSLNSSTRLVPIPSSRARVTGATTWLTDIGPQHEDHIARKSK